jgi:dolichyl-diphosphooligosaccharide---protein glycosyltransferase
LFAGVGIWMTLKHRDYMSISALIIGITAIYVSTGFVRLLVYASLGVIVLAAIGIYEIIRIIIGTRGTLPTIFTSSRSIITDKEKAYDHISDNSGNNEEESSKRKRQRIETRRRAMVITSIALIMVLLILPLKFPPNLNWLSLADMPPTILNGGTGYTFKTNDWLDALNWMSMHTPKNAVIAAWWDYGYWITVLGNRTSLADNATINQTRIATIAKMFMEKPENGIKIATSNLKADYILIYVVAGKIPIQIGDGSKSVGTSSHYYYYTLGGGGDESKIADIIGIGGGFKEQKYLERDEFTPTPRFWNMTLLGTLMPFRLEGYTLLPKIGQGGNLTTIPFKQYKTGSLALYSEDIKYNKEGDSTTTTQPLSLAFSSGNLLANGNNYAKDKVASAVLIYKVNRN